PQLADTPTSKERPRAVVHVDLDGAAHIYQAHGWTYDYPDDPLFETGIKNMLDFFEKNGVKATLFTIASDLEDSRKRELLQEAANLGHEIASHSLTHPFFYDLTHGEKQLQIYESKEKIEKHLGTSVKGFRAPNYQVDRECLELLADYGYKYDSSVFPSQKWAKRLATPSLEQAPHQPLYNCPIIEFPLPQYRPAPFPFHPSYSLILGNRYFKWGMARYRKTGHPLVLLFHLTDFSVPLPPERLRGISSRIYTLSHLSSEIKTARCQLMFDQVKEVYKLTETNSLLAEQEETIQTKQPIILAISTTHETGAAVFEGYDLKSAISEERIERVKLSTKYPPIGSIEESIKVSGIEPQDITDVIISGMPAGELFGHLIKGQISDFLEFHGWNDYFPHLNKVLYRSFYYYRALGYRSVISFLKKRYGIEPNLHFVEHHLSHAASAYRTAPFDEALIVTADGVGDDISFTISIGRNDRIERLLEIRYPHSFGQFYTACTQVLGFRGGRHEGKITGLSGFGKVEPELYDKVKSTIRRSGPKFTLDKRYYSEGIVRGFSWKKIRKNENLFDALSYRNYKTPLKKLLEGYPREDVAAVFQTILEEEVEAAIKPFAEQTGLKNLALAGGVFANVKLNNALFERLDMEQIYIFPAMGDGGLSVGAALEFLQAPPKPFDAPYWGPEYSEDEMEKAIVAAKTQGLNYSRESNIEEVIAKLLADKKVVARFNGRMEFGPRALCNRSILYSAADPEANTWLNKQLHRTEFMPFAPVALAERATELFEGVEGKEHACKFMTIIVNCTDFTKEHCPAIVHVDGTARPQFVTEEINPSMYRILSYYDSITGVPLMVNTSFNMHEEPIVCSPEDAVRGFISASLDYLAMGPFLAWLE
ncbi:MAG TPA: carbamoyltransferase C-terminal domain-containing protein, partial [Desulfosporosinus sp.]|nr:carbamoyltransferase C-terminal domain-containing protein [Desulfosporosinus sp.]